MKSEIFSTITNSCIAPSQIMKKANLYNIEGIISYIEDKQIA